MSFTGFMRALRKQAEDRAELRHATANEIYKLPLRRVAENPMPWEWKNGALRPAMHHPEVVAENRWEDDGGR